MIGLYSGAVRKFLLERCGDAEMRLSQTKVLEALGWERGDFDKDAIRETLGIVLRGIENTLDNVACEWDNDSEAYALGDASNLVQLIRESI